MPKRQPLCEDTVKARRIARTIKRVDESRNDAMRRAYDMAWQLTPQERVERIKSRGPACPGWTIKGGKIARDATVVARRKR